MRVLAPLIKIEAANAADDEAAWRSLVHYGALIYLPINLEGSVVNVVGGTLAAAAGFLFVAVADQWKHVCGT